MTNPSLTALDVMSACWNSRGSYSGRIPKKVVRLSFSVSLGPINDRRIASPMGSTRRISIPPETTRDTIDSCRKYVAWEGKAVARREMISVGDSIISAIFYGKEWNEMAFMRYASGAFKRTKIREGTYINHGTRDGTDKESLYYIECSELHKKRCFDNSARDWSLQQCDAFQNGWEQSVDSYDKKRSSNLKQWNKEREGIEHVINEFNFISESFNSGKRSNECHGDSPQQAYHHSNTQGHEISNLQIFMSSRDIQPHDCVEKMVRSTDINYDKSFSGNLLSSGSGASRISIAAASIVKMKFVRQTKTK